MAKKHKMKLPKRIAGMKIPKGIRKGPIGTFLTSSGGQLVIAEALLAAGGFYAARRLDPNTPAGEAVRHPIDSMRAKLGSYGAGSFRSLRSSPARRRVRVSQYVARAVPGRCTDARAGLRHEDGRGGRSDRKKALVLPRRDVAAGGELRYALIEPEPAGPIGRLTAPVRRWLIDWGKRQLTAQTRARARGISSAARGQGPAVRFACGADAAKTGLPQLDPGEFLPARTRRDSGAIDRRSLVPVHCVAEANAACVQ